MAANELLKRLVEVYAGEKIRHPQLRAVTLAQWLLESGRATSKLATQHYNFGGLKWRPEMAGYATKVMYDANDGKDAYCKFATLESFINGYWAFLNRAPYSGWEDNSSSPEEFIQFIGPIYTPSSGYVKKVLALLPEAEGLLDRTDIGNVESQVTESAVDIGTIVIDPGHGGTDNVDGSSANNAISVSGVKEKKLTLDFCMILREQLIKQATTAGERIKVVLTRTSDVNLTGKKRANFAFDHKAKLFLCLHFNGNKKPSISGVETFYRAESNGNLNLNDDISFATDVHTALLAGLRAVDSTTKDRRLKPDTDTEPGSLGVLNDRNLGNDRVQRMCRSAYIELEFITNPRVEATLVSGPDAMKNRKTVMASLAKAVRIHMRSIPA